MKVAQSIAKRKKICEMARKHSITWVSEHYGVSRPTIYRWLKRYDGSRESLKDMSKKPFSHPNQCTQEEVEIVLKLWKKHKQFGVDYIYGLLKRKHDFKRCRETVYNVLRRENCHYKPPKRKRNRAKNKVYHGAKVPGEKSQMDVKYVPTECLVGDAWQYGKKYYQWTIIDEATSLRFTEFYDDKYSDNSVDFVKKAREYFPFDLKKIQTDNGTEFTNRFSFNPVPSELEIYLETEGIEHQLIKPATPWHNGRVERSHRTDDKFFYTQETFGSLEELKQRGKKWLRKYQNMYQRKYEYLSPMEVWEHYKKTNTHPIYKD